MNKTMLERYEKAQTLMQGILTNKLVRNDAVFPHWISCTDQSDADRFFWYRRQTVEGKEYRLVDTDTASNTRAFDHHVLAKALSDASYAHEEPNGSADSEATLKTIDPLNLPLKSIYMTKTTKGLLVHFQALDKYWHFQPSNSELKEVAAPQDGVLSPDGKKIAFVRDYNIWVRDLSSGTEQALTQDGTKDFKYNYHPWCQHQDTPLWSADSQRILFAQLDERQVETLYHVNYGRTTDGSLRPPLTERKQALFGDEHIPGLQLYASHVATGHLQEADYPPIPAIFCGNFGVGFFDTKLGWWSTDDRRAYFIDTPRDTRFVRVVEWDTESGGTRVVLEETDEHTVRLRHELTEMPLIVPLPDTEELIWFSERSGWGHLYLYDLNSGELKHQITGASDDGGEWLVRNILHVDAEKRELLLQTAARNPEINPYYRDICKVNIDSGALIPLATDDFDYVVHEPRRSNSDIYVAFSRLDPTNGRPSGVSPSGQYLVTTRSRVNTVPVSVLIDRDGREILTLETADVSSLPEDWQWPEPVKLKASDNTADIYAVVFRPPDLSSEQSYPVVDFNSSMRNMCGLPCGSFANNPFCGTQYYLGAAIAALGFIVVSITGRGTPNRSKAFYSHHFGDHAFSSDLTDRMDGLRQLAERYPYMDLERVGLTGNENPSNNAIYGQLLYSDFYKVTVIQCMPDPRFCDMAGNEDLEYAGTSSKTPYPEDCIESFDGKLLLILGMGSWSAHQPTFMLVDALRKANKDFDMLCIPHIHHGVISYTQRREWDYLVTHLQGAEPPKQFQLTRGQDL